MEIAFIIAVIAAPLAPALQHAYESIGLNPAIARKPIEVRRLDGRALMNAAQHRATYSPTLCN